MLNSIRLSFPFRLAVLAVAVQALVPMAAHAQTTYQFKRLSPGLAVTPASTSGTPTPPPTPPAPTAPVLSLSTTSLNFGSSDVGVAAAERSVQLSNTGNAALTFTSALTVSGAGFSASSNCGAGLAVDASCLVNIGFTPTAVGAATGSLSVATNAAGSPASVSLSGTGIGVPTADLNKTSLTFDSVTSPTNVGSNTTQMVRLTNTGTGVLALTAAPYLVGGSTFTIPASGGTTCGSTLAVGTSCETSVKFAPTDASTKTDTLQFATSAGLRTVVVTGTGLQAVGALTANTSADFGPVLVGYSATRVFTFSNSGNVAATGTYAAVTGAGLSLTSNTCGTAGSPATVAAGGTCSVSVAWEPSAPASLVGSLSVTSSAGNSPSPLSLSGSSVAANVEATGGTVLTPGDGYRYHLFTTTGTATLSVTSNASGKTADILVVGGGGGGRAGTSGQTNAAGGGAGGVVESSAVLTAGAFTVTVGQGGNSNSNGSNSSLALSTGTVTALGGGTGGAAGGSGGGGTGGGSSGAIAGGAGTAGQGYAGGASCGNVYAGGGGGAGGAGVAGSCAAAKGGNGGPGRYVSKFTVAGVSGYYGGGGAGSDWCKATPNQGGTGGGGNSAITVGTSGGNGAANTGGGGGGACETSNTPGGKGGSGIVVVRYPYQ